MGPVLTAICLTTVATQVLLYFAARNNPETEPLTEYCHERTSAELAKLPLLADRIRAEALADRIQLAARRPDLTNRSDLTAEQLAAGRAEVLNYLLNQLTMHESVAFVSIGTPDGRYFAADRVTEAGGQVTVLFCDPDPVDRGGTAGRLRMYSRPAGDWKPSSPWLHEYPELYRPQSRPWYQSAVGSEKGVWVEPYLYVTNRDSGLNYSRAIYSQGAEQRLLGVVTASITIRQMGAVLAGALKHKEREEAGAAFLVRETEDGKAYLLADSAETQFRPDLLPASWPRRFQAAIWEKVRPAAPNGERRLEYLEDQYVAQIRPLAIDRPNERVYLVTSTRNRSAVAGTAGWLWLIGLLGLGVGTGLAFRPATRLVRLEAELPKHRRLIEVILETATEALFVKDRDGRYLYANKKCAEDVGQDAPEKMIGKRDEEFFDPESWETIRKTDERVVYKGERFSKTEVLKPKASPTFHYRISKTPWIVGGASYGLVGWAIDLTARESEVQRLRLMLDSVAHDMRTHFLPLELYCEYLPASYIQRARGCIADLEVMAADLMYDAELDKNEREAKPLPLVLEACNLAQELDTLREQQRPLAEKRSLVLRLASSSSSSSKQPAPSEKGGIDIAFEVDKESCAPLFVSDPRRLRHALGNVIGNAIKFSEEGGRVTVRCRVEDGGAGKGRKFVCDVLDTGPGLLTSQSPSPSEQVEPTATKKQKHKNGATSPIQPEKGERHGSGLTDSATPRPATGLGLGLYITRSIVGRLGGTVESGNRPDGLRGAWFRIEVPEADLSKSEGSPQPQRMFPGEDPLRILLADDEPFFIEEIKNRLQQHSPRFQVDVAYRSSQALEMWTQKKKQCDPPYHLVVLDYEMPIMDGPATAQSLISTPHMLNGNKTVLTCMTSALTENRRQKATRAGFAVTMQKNSTTADDIISLIEGRPKQRPTSGDATGAEFPQKLLVELAQHPEHVRKLKETVLELRKLYGARSWRQLRTAAHKLGSILVRYDLHAPSCEIEDWLVPNDDNPKNPSKAEEGIERLADLIRRLETLALTDDKQESGHPRSNSNPL